jgi:hypothetical protein
MIQQSQPQTSRETTAMCCKQCKQLSSSLLDDSLDHNLQVGGENWHFANCARAGPGAFSHAFETVPCQIDLAKADSRETRRPREDAHCQCQWQETRRPRELEDAHCQCQSQWQRAHPRRAGPTYLVRSEGPSQHWHSPASASLSGLRPHWQWSPRRAVLSAVKKYSVRLPLLKTGPGPVAERKIEIRGTLACTLA